MASGYASLVADSTSPLPFADVAAGRPCLLAGLLALLLSAAVAGVSAQPAQPAAEPAPAPAAAAAPDPATIVAAVRLAYGLERAYWDNPRAWPTWERLYQHYRQGFSDDIARKMADFSLSGDGDLATWEPDAVHLADIDGDTAIAWFDTPAEFQDESGWGFERYMVVRLRRESDGRWVIHWGTDSASPP